MRIIALTAKFRIFPKCPIWLLTLQNKRVYNDGMCKHGLDLFRRIHVEYLRRLDTAETMDDYSKLEGILACEHIVLDDIMEYEHSSTVTQ
jgi:hypothetical protein